MLIWNVPWIFHADHPDQWFICFDFDFSIMNQQVIVVVHTAPYFTLPSGSSIKQTYIDQGRQDFISTLNCVWVWVDRLLNEKKYFAKNCRKGRKERKLVKKIQLSQAGACISELPGLHLDLWQVSSVYGPTLFAFYTFINSFFFLLFQSCHKQAVRKPPQLKHTHTHNEGCVCFFPRKKNL